MGDRGGEIILLQLKIEGEEGVLLSRNPPSMEPPGKARGNSLKYPSTPTGVGDGRNGRKTIRGGSVQSRMKAQ